MGQIPRPILTLTLTQIGRVIWPNLATLHTSDYRSLLTVIAGARVASLGQIAAARVARSGGEIWAQSGNPATRFTLETEACTHRYKGVQSQCRYSIHLPGCLLNMWTAELLPGSLTYMRRVIIVHPLCILTYSMINIHLKAFVVFHSQL